MDVFLPVWNTFLVHPLMTVLVAAYGFTRDFGLALVLTTIAIRLVLYPLFVAQIRSTRAMQELAPAMNELKTKYGKDRQRLSEEQMKLYRERGYNPAMGCLPLLVQMPILFAMYSAIIQFAGLESAAVAQFLPPFIPNPIPSGSTIDTTSRLLPWITTGLHDKDPLHILPVLAGLTQLVASVMAMPRAQQKNLDQQAQMMQSMSYYFPVLTVIFAEQYGSGLALYWVATTLFQIVQQYFVTGWGRLARFVPALDRIPSPGERELHRREAAALSEARADMAEPRRAEQKPKGDRPRKGKGKR